MIFDTIVTAYDSISDLRLRLDCLRVAYDAFCDYSDMGATAETFVKTVNFRADEIQLLSHSFFTLLLDALQKAKEAEQGAAKALDEAEKAEPLPDKEAALKTIYATFTLEEKRALCSTLYKMTA